MWDPATNEISDKSLAGAAHALRTELHNLEVNQVEMHAKNRNFLMLGIAGSIIGLLVVLVLHADLRFAAGVAVISFLAYFKYQKKIRDLEHDLVNLLVAEHQGWMYDPAISTDRWSVLAARFPHAFDRGNRGSQFVENQFWGTAASGSDKVPFWSAIFQHVTGSGKTKQTHRQSVVAFKLTRAVPESFYIKPEENLIFSSKDIRTEWEEFNKIFHVSSIEDIKDGRGILQVLSPAVQESLVKLYRDHGSFSLLFHEDTVIFRFSKILFMPKFTNFFKKVELDKRDEEALRSLLGELLAVTGNMLRFLN